MNKTSPVPDELIMFDRQFSWRTASKVARWWFVAFILSATCDVVHPAIKDHWPLGLKVAVLAAEFFALILFCLDAAKWIHDMDELQHRVAVELILFSVSATFGFFLFWLRLDREGFFNAVFGPPIWNNTWGIYSVAHVCALLGGFYGVGFLIFKRRYK